jgi:hypothetical protein
MLALDRDRSKIVGHRLVHRGLEYLKTCLD